MGAYYDKVACAFSYDHETLQHVLRVARASIIFRDYHLARMGAIFIREPHRPGQLHHAFVLGDVAAAVQSTRRLLVDYASENQDRDCPAYNKRIGMGVCRVSV